MKGTTYERAAVSYASLVGATWKQQNDTIDPKRRKITNHAEDNEETIKPSRKTTKVKKIY